MTIDRRRLDLVARKGSAAQVQAITFRTAQLAATMAPGHMKENVRPIFQGSVANPLGIVMVDHPAASFVLHGTPDHEIVAKGGALKFKWKGKLVFFKRVHHPGTKPNNFLLRALEASRIL